MVKADKVINLLTRRLYRDESGATLIEYGFLAALIALGLIGVLSSIGESVLTYFTDINSGFNG